MSWGWAHLSLPGVPQEAEEPQGDTPRRPKLPSWLSSCFAQSSAAELS